MVLICAHGYSSSLAAATLLTGLALHGGVAVQPQVTVLPSGINYACQNNSQLQCLRAPHGRSASVWYEGQATTLQRLDSPAQEKCSDGRTTLYLDGDKAVMSSDSYVVAGPCTSPQPLPVAPMSRY